MTGGIWDLALLNIQSNGEENNPHPPSGRDGRWRLTDDDKATSRKLEARAVDASRRPSQLTRRLIIGPGRRVAAPHAHSRSALFHRPCSLEPKLYFYATSLYIVS
jgi:hypothetical protein